MRCQTCGIESTSYQRSCFDGSCWACQYIARLRAGRPADQEFIARLVVAGVDQSLVRTARGFPEGLYCPSCSAELVTGAKFCRRCGSATTSGRTANAPARETPGLNCPSCDAPLVTGAKFCRRCGKPLASPLGVTPSPSAAINDRATFPPVAVPRKRETAFITCHESKGHFFAELTHAMLTGANPQWWELRMNVTGGNRDQVLYVGRFYGEAGPPERQNVYGRKNGETTLAEMHRKMIGEGWAMKDQGPFWYQRTYTRDA